MCLGRKDVLVINGGTNDSDKNSTKRSGILVMMTQFMQKYNNTNIMVVNIPTRHDLAKDCKTTLVFQAHSVKLSITSKSFRHITLVEMVSNRKYITKHDLHLNSIEK